MRTGPHPRHQKKLQAHVISPAGPDAELEPGQGVPLPCLLKESPGHVYVFGVKQQIEMAAQPLGWFPSRDGLELRVEHGDRAVSVEFPDHHTGRVYKAAVPCLDLAEIFFKPLPVADVAGHDQSQRPGLGMDPARADVDR